LRKQRIVEACWGW